MNWTWVLIGSGWLLVAVLVAVGIGFTIQTDRRDEEHERLAAAARRIAAEHGEPDWREARADYEQARNERADEWHGAA